MTEVTGGSILTGKGPAPIKLVANEPAEVAKQFTLADVDPIGRTEVLIYGKPGTAKTSLAATFPPPFRWIDADNGLKSLRWAFAAGKTSLANLTDLVGYRPTEQLDGMYPNMPVALDRVCDMVTHWFKPEEVDKWKTLVLDSGTELNVWAIYKALHLNGMYPKKEKPLSTSDSINELAKTMLLTGEQDYKSAMGLFMGVLTDIRLDCARHGKNLVLICHEWQNTEDKPEGGFRILSIEPYLMGQLRQRISKDFDDVWHTEIFNGTDLRVQMHSSPTVVAKTRWGNIPDINKDPDYRKMIEKVRAFHHIK